MLNQDLEKKQVDALQATRVPGLLGPRLPLF